MENRQKLEPLLQMSLSATEEELEKAPELSYGNDFSNWEIIFSYIGEFSVLLGKYQRLALVPLLNGYGLANGSKDEIYALSLDPQIIYIEKPKRLFFEDTAANRRSCISRAQALFDSPLTGKGVLIGIIDSGIDYIHPDFRNPDGTTRILLLYDQVLDRIFTEEEINLALSKSTREESLSICPSVDLSGHGTHVAGIAAGNGQASDGQIVGVAPEATLLVVRLGIFNSLGFPGTGQLMKAITFCVMESEKRSLPLALNISFGNTYGSHSGSSLLETFLSQIANHGRLAICVGSGNEGASAGHTSGILTEKQIVEFSIGEYTTAFSLQLWKRFEDRFDISIYNPISDSYIQLSEEQTLLRYRTGNTLLYVYYGTPSPYSSYQEIFLEFIPDQTYLDSGIWNITLSSVSIRSGEWEMWMPASAVRTPSTRFLSPNPDTTLTIPSTAFGVITVGAYDSTIDAYAAFSGRGNTYGTNQAKPDLVAPGVDILSCAPGGSYEMRTGTSMATPFVTGSSALLMQWGIIEGNDPYLYGEKLKAYLRRGARSLPLTQKHPNPQTGWGALCLSNSFPFV